jgi:competence protein ComEA
MSTTLSRATRRSVQVLIASLIPMLPMVAAAGAIDINKADAATIAKELQGIGLSRAQAIVAYREKNGAFKSADELRKVKGIGAKTLELNRANIRVGRGGQERRLTKQFLQAPGAARQHRGLRAGAGPHRRKVAPAALPLLQSSLGYHPRQSTRR